MKFYIVKEAGVTLGCVRTLKAVKQACQRLEAPGVLEVEVPVNAETVRKLLGELGASAVQTRETIIV